MMDYSNSGLVFLRRVGQSLGVLKPMQHFYRRIARSSYEERFDRALLDFIKPGTVVWDVGANVGHYTRKFAELVGASGRVVAFEPAPASARRIRESCASFPWVEVAELALSDCDGRAEFDVVSDTAPTNSLTSIGAGRGARQVLVEVARASSLIQACRYPSPNVVKVDVEGFELEVLRGLGATLRKATLHGLFIEIHFSVLNQRRLPNAARMIVSLLRDAGLSVKWLDASHVEATRS